MVDSHATRLVVAQTFANAIYRSHPGTGIESDRYQRLGRPACSDLSKVGAPIKSGGYAVCDGRF